MHEAYGDNWFQEIQQRHPRLQDSLGTSALARNDPLLLWRNDPPSIEDLCQGLAIEEVVVMMNHHGRGPEETLHDMPAVVQAGCTNRKPTTSMPKRRVPISAA
jgi:hypothetical protein